MVKVTVRTKPAKKPASRTKAAPKKKSVKKTARWNNLTKELKTLMPKLDEEGLAFLVKQSQVHLYNMQVDALNKTIIKEEQHNKTASVKKRAAVSGVFSEVKMGGAGSYYIVYGNESIIFAKEEMSTLVKIALSGEPELEVRERVYNWLLRERSDLLYAAGIRDKLDNKIKSLIVLLKNNFKLKK